MKPRVLVAAVAALLATALVPLAPESKASGTPPVAADYHCHPLPQLAFSMVDGCPHQSSVTVTPGDDIIFHNDDTTSTHSVAIHSLFPFALGAIWSDPCMNSPGGGVDTSSEWSDITVGNTPPADTYTFTTPGTYMILWGAVGCSGMLNNIPYKAVIVNVAPGGGGGLLVPPDDWQCRGHHTAHPNVADATCVGDPPWDGHDPRPWGCYGAESWSSPTQSAYILVCILQDGDAYVCNGTHDSVNYAERCIGRIHGTVQCVDRSGSRDGNGNHNPPEEEPCDIL